MRAADLGLEHFLLMMIIILLCLPMLLLRKAQGQVQPPRRRLHIRIKKEQRGDKLGVMFSSNPSGGSVTTVIALDASGLFELSGVMVGDHVVAVGTQHVQGAMATSQALAEVAGSVLLTVERAVNVDAEALRCTFPARIQRPSPAFPLGVELASSGDGAEGVLIQSLDETSPMRTSGLLAGDIIVEIGGVKPMGATSASELLHLMTGSGSDIVELLVERRDGQGDDVEALPLQTFGGAATCRQRQGEAEPLMSQ